MPTYHARGVSVRIGAMPLTDTITPNVVLKKGDIAAKQCKEAEQKLLHSNMLLEEHVNFPEDSLDFELNWLGRAPFMQVQVGHDLVEQGSHGKPACTGASVNTAQVQRQPMPDSSYKYGCDPLALSLHVILSDRTFTSGLDRNNKLHLKIEVFFNGQISSCFLLPPYEIRSGVKTLHQVFAGYRVDYLAERPWVILPSQIKENGIPSKAQSWASTDERWSDICEALSREADDRGSNVQGQVPPSAEFLKALATMPMPEQVKSMQKPGGKKFGIVDVVITAGGGKKLTTGTCYLRAPQRFFDENFPLRVSPSDLKDDVPIVEYVATHEVDVRNNLAPIVRSTVPHAEVESDLEFKPKPKRRALSRHVLPNHPKSKTSLARLAQTQCKDIETSTFPAPLQHTHINFPHDPIASGFIRKSDLSQLLVSYESSIASLKHGQTVETEYEGQFRPDVLNNIPCTTLQSSCSFPSSSSRLVHAPPMHPLPYSLQYSDPLPGQDSPKASTDMSAFSHAKILFSSLQQIQQTPSRQLSPPLPSPSTQKAGHDSLSSATSPSSVLSPSQLWHRQTQQYKAPQVSSHVQNILPSSNFSRHFTSRTSEDLPYHPPYDRRLSLPLPPTGFFSVPTKPKLHSSLRKKLQPATLGMSRPNLLLRRLIIMGKGGVIVVDHQYTEPRRWPDSRLKSTVKIDNIADKDPIKSPIIADMKPRNTSRSILPRQRTTFSDGVRGVQGPKATTIWFDDPEEVLRGPRKTRQSQTTAKRKSKSLVTIGDAMSTPTTGVSEVIDKDSSWSLSNIPAIPEPLNQAYTGAPQSQSNILSGGEATDPVLQANGLPEGKSAALSPLETVLPLIEHDAASYSKLLPEISPLVKPLSLPTTKKRSRNGRSLQNQRRSPDGIKTVSNPRLNQDCVIAFAESEDKGCERGVLRQVKGERQGVFAEEYVVVATRFFVAGN
jgi:hypothetical protein